MRGRQDNGLTSEKGDINGQHHFPPGSYTRTSRNITFTEVPGQTAALLSAECQQRDGSWVKSTLKYEIANNDGVLMWAPAGID